VHHLLPVVSGGRQAASVMQCGTPLVVSCEGGRVSRVRDKAELLGVEINGQMTHRRRQIGGGYPWQLCSSEKRKS
jgi:hypothetical protein